MRVLQDSVVKSWREDAKELKKKKESASGQSLPGNITLALTGLPVGSTLAIGVKTAAENTADNTEEKHSVVYRQPSDNTALAVLPGPDPTAGEAAEIRPAVLTNTPHPIDFPCNSKELCYREPETVIPCSESSNPATKQLRSQSSSREATGQHSASSPTRKTRSRNSTGTRSGSTPRSTVGKCEGWRYEEQGRAECGEIFQKRNWKQLRCDRCRGELQNATTLAWRNRKNKKTAAVFEVIRDNLGS